jgi:hypothetical protein
VEVFILPGSLKVGQATKRRLLGMLSKVLSPIQVKMVDVILLKTFFGGQFQKNPGLGRSAERERENAESDQVDNQGQS